MFFVNSGPSAQNIEEYASRVLKENTRWAKKLNKTFPQYFPNPEEKQAPKILWLGCSDSRVHESDATTALPGTAFVHRNIANQFHLHDDNALSVLAYALKELDVQHVVIVGHEHCDGVVTAMKEARGSPGQDGGIKHHHTLQDSFYILEEVLHRHHQHQHQDDTQGSNKTSALETPNHALTRWLTPLVDRLRGVDLPEETDKALKIAVEENVKMQVENMEKMDVFVRKWARGKSVWVHGWVYDTSTGLLRDLEITRELGGREEVQAVVLDSRLSVFVRTVLAEISYGISFISKLFACCNES